MIILNKKLRRLALKCTTTICTALFPAFAFAQADIHFSQFYEESILRNPALTGVFSKDYKLGAYYRSQWASISNPYNTFLASAETHMQVRETSEDFVSFGLLAYYDKAGSIDQKITSVYPAINYNKSLNSDHNTFLSFGFTGGYIQYSFDPNKATFNNQYQNNKFNPSNPTLENLPNAKMNVWDLGAGVNFNTSAGPGNALTYVIGFSGYHFTQPKFSYYQKEGITQNMRINGNASMAWNMQDNVSSQIHVNYAMQGTYRELMVGGIINWVQATQGYDEVFLLSGGLFYRYQDAIIPVFKVSYRSLAFGISYDVNISTLQEASNMQGGYEFTLFYTGNFIDRGIAKKTVCPKF
jgi:type IX secretion system PorP/SprF family membrane protein